MKALITGSEGFIGRNLSRELKDNGYDVVCCDIVPGADSQALDIMDKQAVKDIISTSSPDVIINLAGLVGIGLSWKDPQRAVELNTIGTINILEAIRESGIKTKLVVVGSAGEYGRLYDHGENVTEDMPVKPEDPYSISKYMQEMFCKIYIDRYGLDISAARLFNIVGAGQPKGFLFSDFAGGVAAAEAGVQDQVLVGNLQSARDYVHITDACKALRLIIEKGRSAQVYNICSGKAYKAREILDMMLALAEKKIQVAADSSRMRPSDTPLICGSHEKLTAHTGWMPQKNIEYMVEDVLAYEREEVKKQNA